MISAEIDFVHLGKVWILYSISNLQVDKMNGDQESIILANVLESTFLMAGLNSP